jgi:hypothetical protein
MSDAGSPHRQLMADLVDDLRPVRPLVAPIVRVVLWLAVVVAIALVLARFADLAAMRTRFMGTPDMAMAAAGSSLTAVLAAIATFELGLPDRSAVWAWLPLPGLLLWIGASGLGCARGWLAPGTSEISFADTSHCLRFIVLMSLPLSLAIFLLLRRSYSLYPTLMGSMAGLAVAAAAATLLNFFHPYDAALDDLLVHAGAVMMVVAINRALGGWLFVAKRSDDSLRR